MIDLPVDGVPTDVVNASVVEVSVMGLPVGVEVVMTTGGSASVDTESSTVCINIRTKFQ